MRNRPGPMARMILALIYSCLLPRILSILRAPPQKRQPARVSALPFSCPRFSVENSLLLNRETEARTHFSIRRHHPGVPAVAPRNRGRLCSTRMQVRSPAQLKEPVLPQLQLRSQLWLGFDPWPRNSICHRAASKRGEKRKV